MTFGERGLLLGLVSVVIVLLLYSSVPFLAKILAVIGLMGQSAVVIGTRIARRSDRNRVRCK